ncbi:MAG: hypothetical protein PHO62_04335 [Sulfurimonas sp.]|uniref:hypothetical protein n=1 Tax=Sulfurimonas sp. TaxID=2022749 RepID=UPI00262DAEAC|nr:hypothetical protein [Sulfurimonas sp.]MDD5372639.1 hypothetical protein [Sulfurimonas sp.]
MSDNYIEMLEPTPKLYSKKCKFISFLLKLFLQFTTPLSSLAAWYLYDYFIAMLTLVLSFIVMGIVRSKLRNSVIPPAQREYHYNDKGIADWYTAKELCYETH